MELMGKNQIASFRTRNFMVFTPGFILLSIIPSSLIGWQLGDFTAFIFVAGVLAVITPIFLSHQLAKWQAKKVNQSIFRFVDVVQKELNQADYYNACSIGGIGLDLTENKIAVIDNSKRHEACKNSLFGASQILSYNAHSPGYSTIESVGRATLSEQSNIAQANGSNQYASELQTGLYFDLDDIDNPKVFAPMPYKEAEKWMLVIKKFIDGDLEQPVEPRAYPAGIGLI